MHDRSIAAVTGTLVAVALLAGCGTEEARGTASGRCAPPTPAADASALPAALATDALGTVTRVARTGGHVTATAVAEGEVEQVQQRFSRAVERAGYTVVGSENEVVEGDVYFEGRRGATGGAKFVQTGCDGRVRVRLFVGGAADRSG